MFLCTSPSCVLRQGLSLNPELTDRTSLTGRLLWEICSLLPSIWNYRWAATPIMGYDPNPSSHLMSSLSREPSCWFRQALLKTKGPHAASPKVTSLMRVTSDELVWKALSVFSFQKYHSQWHTHLRAGRLMNLSESSRQPGV